VKNPTLRLVTNVPNPATPIMWALVYAPQGFPPASLTLQTGAAGNDPVSIFEPNQNVIMSGWLNDLGTHDPVTYKPRLARNLDSGDQVLLLLYNPSSQATTVIIAFTLNYAICYG
jgi:hypothetical protein